MLPVPDPMVQDFQKTSLRLKPDQTPESTVRSLTARSRFDERLRVTVTTGEERKEGAKQMKKHNDVWNPETSPQDGQELGGRGCAAYTNYNTLRCCRAPDARWHPLQIMCAPLRGRATPTDSRV